MAPVRKDRALPLAIREEEYEFVDPRPEEMKHVNSKPQSAPRYISS